MGDVVSLNKYRKTRERAAAPQQAAVNRAKFGRSKPETRETNAPLQPGDHADCSNRPYDRKQLVLLRISSAP